jgi:ABC-type oligopeptide transport system ATPase subunit
MGDTVEVFGRSRHPYAKNLLDAAPELHKKWRRPAGEAETGHGADAAGNDVPFFGDGTPAGNGPNGRPTGALASA